MVIQNAILQRAMVCCQKTRANVNTEINNIIVETLLLQLALMRKRYFKTGYKI